MHPWGPAFCLLAIVCACAAGPPIEPGVTRALAAARAAQISEVRYRLELELVPQAPRMPGREQISFHLASAGAPVVLDYRLGNLRSLFANGSPVADLEQQNGHIRVPAGYFHAGENQIALAYESEIAPAGRALTRYLDRDDGSEYIYSLFVPMDASMAFPCFDQPDLKARFTLTVTAPETWTVVSNAIAAESALTPRAGFRRTDFGETLPISTYLFAFAAGPFRILEGGRRPIAMRLFVRNSKFAQAVSEAPELFTTTRQGVEFLESFFDHRFPFAKYDQVLLPGFAFGGMEHAGATFLREESVLFRSTPTLGDHRARAALVLHELSHQWFGDLVTMRWFDDLWLKEGFATYMAYRTMAAIYPPEEIWKRFYQANKPAAYAIDATRGATPIYQEVPNLLDAKSAYGAIVYAKAPGLLRQLSFLLGEDAFRAGVRTFLKDHAYDNAAWSDLIRAYEGASGRSLSAWADAWIRRRGVPEVRTDWACDAEGHITRFQLDQRDVLGEGRTWPLKTELLAGERTLAVTLENASTLVPELLGTACPAWLFANAGDYAYGRFLLDDRSRAALLNELGSVSDPFLRTMLWGALWDAVRETQMAPADYLRLALRLLPAENDEALSESILAHTVLAFRQYLDDATRAALAPQLEALCSERMLTRSELDLRIVYFRAFRSLATTPGARGTLKAILSGKLAIQGLQIKPLDRWQIVTNLLAASDPEADALLAAERRRDPQGDGPKYAYIAEAARADAQTKRRYFDDYLHNPSVSEDWVQQSLTAFNSWNQAALTEPYLKPALDALPQVKRERKIFFLLAWLNAFLGGQHSAEAADEVQTFLRTHKLDADLERKILEVSDELDRTIRIRQKYGAEPQAPAR